MSPAESSASHLPVLLFLVPFTAALVSVALGWVVRGSARVIALATLVATAALSVAAIAEVAGSGPLSVAMAGWGAPLGIELVLDPLSAFMAAVVGLVALVAVAGAVPLAARELAGRETVYYPTVLLLVAGLMGMCVSGDLFNLYVQIEVASLSAYALVAAGGRGAPRAGMHYLIVGSIGATFYLMGVAFVYAATGTLNMADAAARLPDAEPRLVLAAGLLMLVGLGTKMAAFPLHLWMPEAYRRCPAVAAPVMAALVTKVSAYAVLRILFWVLPPGEAQGRELLLDLLAWSGAISVVFGGALALAQNDLRRMLAYSSLAQIGIVAMGAGLATQTGMAGAILHLGADALMKALLFLAAAVALVHFGVERISDLPRLRGRAPWTSAAITIGGLSLIGIPPLAGFFGKWYVLRAAIETERWVLVAALALGSLATVGYVARILEQLFYAPAQAEPAQPGRAPVPVAALLILAAALIAVGLANAAVLERFVLPGLAEVLG